jgi:hypothetical protein
VLAFDESTGARLAEKALDDLGVSGELGIEQHLQRTTLEGGGVARLIHRSHATTPDQAQKLVLSGDDGAGQIRPGAQIRPFLH